MQRDIHRRLAALEAHTAATQSAVAIRVDYADHVAVWVGGTNERMPLADWYARYPDGTLINWLHGEPGADRGLECLNTPREIETYKHATITLGMGTPDDEE